MEYISFKKLRRDDRISLFFPGWKPGEKVAFYSPHDDDAVLGAGYLLLATLTAGGIPHVFIFCRGDAGYSTAAEKKGLAKKRKEEASRAYGILGVPPENIRFFDIPDFSLMARLDRLLPSGQGLFEKIIGRLRKEQISRVVFSSGYLEHWDHTAVYNVGVYFSSQAQDPILVDLGKPFPMKTFLAYSVWGDIEPASARDNIRADLGILATEKEEQKVLQAVRAFSSQKRIIQSILVHRRKRKTEDGYLELYKSIQVREPIDFSPYFKLLKKLKKR
jgi:LmbE family N-acetylglucosaminyl deacetylase